MRRVSRKKRRDERFEEDRREREGEQGHKTDRKCRRHQNVERPRNSTGARERFKKSKMDESARGIPSAPYSGGCVLVAVGGCVGTHDLAVGDFKTMAKRFDTPPPTEHPAATVHTPRGVPNGLSALRRYVTGGPWHRSGLTPQGTIRWIGCTVGDLAALVHDSACPTHERICMAPNAMNAEWRRRARR